MITYLDKVQFLYPNIQRVMYWHEKNSEADFDDPYDRLLWENTDIEKPTKEILDAIKDEDVIVAKEATIVAQKETLLKEDPLFKIVLAREKLEDPTVTADKLITDGKTVTVTEGI